ncbi:hypothetical protein [Paenibacillus agilis]|uniref:Uncharacterized protein n=1 Tax=Paenibacillus agilis TaxID=3020863 RepID=A0A559J2U2_9BACL|nr:hypothetical protein [Paenibacillus agilis]TVX94181.1 hypothetical protein FPZ44_14650 [Paenibacillus agilis]
MLRIRGCTVWKRIINVGIALLLMAGLVGCKAPFSQPPEEVLTRAISGMAGKDQFFFEGIGELKVGERQLKTKTIRFQGEVHNHRSTHMKMTRQEYAETTPKRWNPIRLLTDIRTSHKKVSYVDSTMAAAVGNDAESSSSEAERPEILVRVDLEPDEAKRVFNERMLEEFETAVVPSRIWSQGKENRSEAEQQALQALLYNQVESYRNTFIQMLQESKVQASYYVWIDRKSQLPHRIEGQMDVVYRQQGIPYKEAIRTTAKFTQFR